ncbi:2,4-dienoyl-CoA reductase-like NADH-dependent reductase (Old Yellow Enzyme family) [Bradyrhizobium sp. JR6.1]
MPAAQEMIARTNPQITSKAGHRMTELPLLFTPLQLRDLELKNRIMVSPMATYSAQDGRATDWHTAHIGKLAAGGAGLVFVEQSSVNVQGRITHGCLGIWDDTHIADHAALAALIHSFNAKAAIQIAHGGRKGSAQRPWEGGNPLGEADIKARGEGPWQIAASSGIPFDDGWPAPQMMTSEQIDTLVDDYRQAFRRARAAGYDVIELHCAHGYLMHSFLSPLSPTTATTSMAGRAKIACACRCGSLRSCARNGLITCQPSSASRRSTASTSAGRSRTPSHLPPS